MNIDFKKLSERIREYRILRGLTQAQLAESVDVNESYISRIETGSSSPSLKLLFLIACVLEVSLDILVQDSKKLINVTDNQDIHMLLQECSESDKEMIKVLLEAFVKNKKTP